MKLYIMRHGESMATLDPTLYGRADPVNVPVSEWGHEQALESGQALKGHFDAIGLEDVKPTIYFSTHHRIAQTKDALIEGLGADVEVTAIAEPLLVERHHGEFDGLNSQAQEAYNKEIFDKLHYGSSEERYTTKMPGGESLQDVADRLDAFLDKVRDTHQPDDVVIIVTHGGNCTSLEQKINHAKASWIEPKFDVPKTGDIIEADTDLLKPAPSETIIDGKQRPKHLPKNYKSQPHGQWDEAHLLKDEFQSVQR